MRKLATTVIIALLFSVQAFAAPAEDEIRKLLHSTFDKPETRLIVDPVVVAGDHAIAGWSQGEIGGRALLHRRGGAWSLILCSGDGIKTAAALRQAGLPVGEAGALARRLAEAERKMPPERLALFSKFEGIVMMDASGKHPPH